MNAIAETGVANAQPPRGRCWDCNYSLHGLAELRCPECGRSFDPANPESFNQGKPMGGLPRRLLGPACWYAGSIRLYCCGALLLTAIVPLNRWTALILFFAFWAVLGLLYFFRTVLRSIVIRHYDQPEAAGDVDAAIRRRVQRWTLWTGALIVAQAPLYHALSISLPWLNALARERYERMPMVTVNDVPLKQHQYGLFRVMAVDVDAQGADLYIWQSDYGAPRLRYSPDGGSFDDFLKGKQLTPSWSIR